MSYIVYTDRIDYVNLDEIDGLYRFQLLNCTGRSGTMIPQRHILVTFTCLLLSVLTHAQEAWTVVLNGKVSEYENPLNRVVLILKKNGQEVQKLFTAPNGKFTVELYADNEYHLQFTKKGYVTKFIEFNTNNVPKAKEAGLYSEFIFEIDLFKEMEGLNTSILEFPVFKVKYYPDLKNLDYDKKHEAKIRSRLNVLLKDYAAMKERESSDAENAKVLVEKNRLNEGYNMQIDIANSFAQKKKYKEAQDAYEKALVIKPKASFPRDRIVAIEKLIKKQNTENKLSKEMEERYTELLKSADVAFNNDKYASARSLYRRAALIAPDRSYPIERIVTAGDELALTKGAAPFKNVADEKYGLILSRADNEYMGEDYMRARNSYAAALRVKTSEQYPKIRIRKIDSIVTANKVQRAEVVSAVTAKKPKLRRGSKARIPPRKTEEEHLNEYLLNLAEKYDEGITEELEVSGGKKVTRIIVVEDGKANEYKKEVFSWATYYRKNNEIIPKYVFENETKR